jgi:hypothetical protein
MNTEIIEKTILKSGTHKSFDDGACIMELVSYVAGEKWSDRPECSCQTLTTLAIGINDRVDEETRQKLKSIVPLIINTRGTREDRIARSRFIAHRTCTVTMSILAETLGLNEIAEKLKLFEPSQLREISVFLRKNKKAFRDTGRRSAVAYLAAAATAAASDAAEAAADSEPVAAIYADTAVNAAAGAYTDVYADNAAKRKKIKNEINDSSIEILRLACGVWSEKPEQREGK